MIPYHVAEKFTEKQNKYKLISVLFLYITMIRINSVTLTSIWISVARIPTADSN